jgi:tripartite-type tricarboxylate transporter receptor subunit TctC
MMWPWTRFFVIPSVFVALALSAQTGWPETRTIKIVVPNPPGASTNILARLLAEQVGRATGETLVVENRPGAGNIVGSEAVARAAPDGKTLLINANPFVIDPHLRKLSYDPLTSFEPVCYLANSPSIIVVNSTSPYRTLDDLLTAARNKPGTLTLAAVGPGTAAHMAFAMLKHAAEVDMVFVPYPGNPPAINALMGEHVNAVISGYPVVAELVKSGKLRALATTTRTRIEPLPDLPTVAEFGYKDYGVDFWMGVVAPANTPPESISQLSGWFTAAMKAPETRARLLAQALYPVGICGADFAAFIRKQFDDYGRLIRASQIKVE